jgi:hypothetical protein
VLGVVPGAGLLFLERCGLPVPTAATLRAAGLAALVPGVATCEPTTDRVAEEVRAGLGLDPSQVSVLAREVLECGLPVLTAAALRGTGLADLVPGVATCEPATDRVVEEVRAGLGLDLSRFLVVAREVLEFREVFPLDWWGSSTVPDVGFVATWTPVVLWMYEPLTCLHECRGL